MLWQDHLQIFENKARRIFRSTLCTIGSGEFGYGVSMTFDVGNLSEGPDAECLPSEIVNSVVSSRFGLHHTA
jgi:hypothetical protein